MFNTLDLPEVICKFCVASRNGKLTLMTCGLRSLKRVLLPLVKKVVILAGEEPPAPEPTLEKETSPSHEDDPDWVNKVSRDGQIVIFGTGFTDAVTAEFSSDGNPETFNVTARTFTSITGQIAGGLEAGGTLVMELKDGAGDVIDTASVEVVEG